MRAGAELLLLSSGLRSLSHRGVSGGGGVFQVQLLLLYHRLSHFAGRYENGDLTVKTADGDELVLHTENAIVMDTQTAAAADLSALKAGESVYVYHDEAVTMSLPAQTTAY